MAKAEGTAAVAAAAFEDLGAARAAEAPEQLSLLGECAAPAPAMEEKSGRGPGRATVDLVEYLAGCGCVPPALYLARSFSMPLARFLEAHGLDDTAENRLWAIERRDKNAIACLPFVHRRQPMKAEITDRRTITLQVEDAGSGDELDLARVLESYGHGPVVDAAAETVEDQGDSDD